MRRRTPENSINEEGDEEKSRVEESQAEISAVEARPEVIPQPDNSVELERLRDKVAESFPEEKKSETALAEDKTALLGDFVESQLTESGKIVLETEEQKEIAEQLKKHKADFQFSPPSLFRGAKTDTEYDSKVGNFSTRTKILELENGKRVFAVYNYPLSGIHRFFDGLCKHMAGDRMSKASGEDWKGVFEERSNVPVIECDDPNVVLMPYLPNINAHDLFARNNDIKDFGACPWAENFTMGDKLDLASQIIQELENVHNEGKCWGETILPNVIVTAEKRVVIVDPETQYDKDVPIKEQMARDLRDMIMSICGSLKTSEKEEDVGDYHGITERLMASYSDKGVIQELKKLAGKKPTFVQKILRGSYEQARLGISQKEYEKVYAAILES